MTKELKTKLIGFKSSESDYNNIKELAERMNLDVSKLLRLSIEPYFIKERVVNQINGMIDKGAMNLETLLNTRNILNYWLSELETQVIELKSKLENINIAEKIISNQVESKQLNLGFKRHKQSRKKINSLI
jgi:hypothetical protein